MPDITMCSGQGCQLKESCYRYTALKDEYQSYFVDSPIEDGKCDYHWVNQNQSVPKRLKEIVKVESK